MCQKYSDIPAPPRLTPPTPRAPLQSTPSTQHIMGRGKEVSEQKRAEIIGMHKVRTPLREITNIVGVPKSTASDIIRRWRTSGTVKSSPRSGRPPKTTLRNDRAIHRAARIDRDQTYADIKATIAPWISRSTFARRLRKVGIRKYRKTKRQYLDKKAAAARLKWCKAHRHWTAEDWENKVIWSDECSVEKGGDPRTQWVFRTKEEKFHPDCVQGQKKGNGVKVMVWGCFVGGYMSGLWPVERNEETGKVDSEAYIRTLEKELPYFMEYLQEQGIPPEDLLFMQDNAPVHTAGYAMAWFRAKGYRILKDWPPYSPDLNPIEHAWYKLKTHLARYYPHLARLTRSPQVIRPILTDALIHCWELINPTHLRNLAASMPRRIKAVIRARGWYTKY